MATISISQLDTATQAKVDDLYEVAVVDANSQTGYASRKLTAAQIATLIAQGVQFSGLSTEAKTIIASINEAAQNGGTEVEANPAGESTDTLKKIGIDGTIYEVGGNEPVSKTVTGNPINITDAADAPIVSGEVTFEPKQDLHGYDKPWAGGAGKNKVNPSTIENGYYSTSGYVSNNNFRTSEPISVNVGRTYSASLFNTNDLTERYSVVITTYSSGDTTNAIRQIVNESNITIESGEAYVRVRNNSDQTSLVVSGNYAYQLEDGAIQTPFTPYSNICPIEGYTECEVEVTGKNLCYGTVHGYVETTFINVNNNAESAIFYAVKGQTYTLSSTATMNRSRLGRVDTPNVENATTVYEYVALADSINTWQATWTGWTVWYKCNSSQPNFASSVQLELGSTATLYEPYQSKTCTIDLDGTRYGGRVYHVTGKMSDSMGHIASYAGETIGEPWLSDRDEYVAGTTPTIGAEVVYTLASPTIVQLTPQQIRTLEGTNNISTNMTGMSLEYITQDYQPLVELIERSAGHHYSTQERVVGTWFGKPLYEKVFSVTLPTFDYNQWTVIDSAELSNVSEMPECLALKDTSTQSGLPSTFAVIGALNNNNKLQIMNLRNADYGQNIPARIIVQYTKTTD